MIKYEIVYHGSFLYFKVESGNFSVRYVYYDPVSDTFSRGYSAMHYRQINSLRMDVRDSMCVYVALKWHPVDDNSTLLFNDYDILVYDVHNPIWRPELSKSDYIVEMSEQEHIEWFERLVQMV